MQKRLVYADYAATTPIHNDVKREIIDNLDVFGNASSLHYFGRVTRDKIESSRKTVADFLGADPSEIIFTAGGTESNNTVLNSVACSPTNCNLKKGSIHIITSNIEHPSVIAKCKCLEEQGVDISYLACDDKGIIDPQKVKDAIKENTKLISIMFANNELGSIQPILEIAEIARQNKILMHTDAVQVTGKIPFKINQVGVSFLSVSGHKIGAPKGIGILYAKTGSSFCPLLKGGHQEGVRRAGTENSLGIIGIGKAFACLNQEMSEDITKIKALKEKLRSGIVEKIPDI